MEAKLQSQIDFLDACIEIYNSLGPLDGEGLVNILQKITASLYFIEDERSKYHDKFQNVIHKLVLEKKSVNRAENEAHVLIPELYMLRHKMDAAYRCVDSIRSKISWIKQERNSF